jgi:hypothetical protein
MRFVLNIECDNEAFFGRLNMTPTTRPQREALFRLFRRELPIVLGRRGSSFWSAGSYLGFVTTD